MGVFEAVGQTVCSPALCICYNNTDHSEKKCWVKLNTLNIVATGLKFIVVEVFQLPSIMCDCVQLKPRPQAPAQESVL